MKTVFFGPFIGEFGWEYLYWQGWVRKVCKSEFKGYRKIASSFPGRQPFYPYVDEFWPLPESFVRLGVSGHGYYTDGWRGGYPGIQYEAYTLKSVLGPLRRLRRPYRVWMERPLTTRDVQPQAEAMLAEFKQRLPEDTVYFVPWKANYYEPYGLEFGVQIPFGGCVSSTSPFTKPIDYSYQLFEYLKPSPEGEKAFRQFVPEERKLIAVFPRCRVIRRPDKNWPREKYVDLIRRLQQAWPDFTVVIVGEPGGVYFADGVLPGCLDLTNVPAKRRLDIQIAALKRSAFALGSMSGALTVAMAAGCPTLIWGFDYHLDTYCRANMMCTPLIYHQQMDPSVEVVFRLADALRSMTRNWIGDPRAV